jgi:hypothetical protein
MIEIFYYEIILNPFSRIFTCTLWIFKFQCDFVDVIQNNGIKWITSSWIATIRYRKAAKLEIPKIKTINQLEIRKF